VEKAQSLLAADLGDQVPFWSLAWGPVAATVHSRSAKVFEKLGDRPRAEEEFAAAAAGRPTDTYARIFALDLVDQGRMQHAQGHLEHACSTWGKAIDGMEGIQSVRTRKAVVSIRRSLSTVRSRRVRVAQELDEKARGFLAV
jgi:hypothetical protein